MKTIEIIDTISAYSRERCLENIEWLNGRIQKRVDYKDVADAHSVCEVRCLHVERPTGYRIRGYKPPFERGDRTRDEGARLIFRGFAEKHFPDADHLRMGLSAAYTHTAIAATDTTARQELAIFYRVYGIHRSLVVVAVVAVTAFIPVSEEVCRRVEDGFN